MRFWCLSLVLASLTIAPAATLPKANPEEAGLSSQRLQRVHAVLQRYIDKGEIAGAVALVARNGKVAYFDAQGIMDLETKRAMRPDSVFRLASMTKPVTSLAIMMLQEEGLLLIDDPVSKYLPEFKSPKVAIGNSPS